MVFARCIYRMKYIPRPSEGFPVHRLPIQPSRRYIGIVSIPWNRLLIDVDALKLPQSPPRIPSPKIVVDEFAGRFPPLQSTVDGGYWYRSLHHTCVLLRGVREVRQGYDTLNYFFRARKICGKYLLRWSSFATFIQP